MLKTKTSTFDVPANQIKILNYIRNKGKIDGAASIVDRTDTALDWYISKNPMFKARIRLAKDQFLSGDVDDLQTHWNHNAEEYNADLIARLLSLLLEGEVIRERNEVKAPVKNEKGEIQYDEFGEPELKLIQVYDKTVHKPTPKYIIEMALELMSDRFGQPELAKVAPTIVLRFMQFVQRESESLPGDALKELFGLASTFDTEFKQEVLAMTGKTK